MATSRTIAGIDWATEPKNRAAVVLKIDCDTQRIVVDQVLSPLASTDITNLCKQRTISTVGIDIPFGWPRKFSEFVSDWTPTSGASTVCPASLDYRYRTTDRFVHSRLGKWPLSVSSERFALGTRLWCELYQKENLNGRIDLIGNRPTGAPTIIEVYPAATLAALSKGGLRLAIAGYKADEKIRRPLLKRVTETFGITFTGSLTLEQIVGSGKGSDMADALIAALTAAVYDFDPALATGGNGATPLGGWRICKPSEAQRADALKEGWIFFPTK